MVTVLGGSDLINCAIVVYCVGLVLLCWNIFGVFGVLCLGFFSGMEVLMAIFGWGFFLVAS